MSAPSSFSRQPATDNRQPKTVVIGPVPPYRAGIAYCTKRLAEVLGAEVISFKRQFPRFLYPGSTDVDPTLPRFEARFLLDILNPLTWLRTALTLRREKPDVVIFVWWVWVWALPYLTLLAFLPKATRVLLQCHNIGDKEPAAWKRWLTNKVLRRGDVLVVHAKTEAEEAARRLGGVHVIPSVSRGTWGSGGGEGDHASRDARPRLSTDARDDKGHIVQTFLPVHELGGAIPTRTEARKRLGLNGNVALFFGHVRPFKGLDIALRAWRLLQTDVTLVVAGEAWWKGEETYRQLAKGLHNVRFDFRYIPDSEIATYFAAADVVLAPYRIEAQSGVALTAFHFARPVIASDAGGLPEIVEPDMVFPSENHVTLAARIDSFFERPDRAKLEQRAADAARKYSWEEYGALFRRLGAGE